MPGAGLVPPVTETAVPLELVTNTAVSYVEPAVSIQSTPRDGSVTLYQTFGPFASQPLIDGPSRVAPTFEPITVASPPPDGSGTATALVRTSLPGRQTPETHATLVPQLFPHEPQFDASVLRLTHALPQSDCPDGHDEVTQLPPMQLCVPEHVVPQPPQFIRSVIVFTHEPPHAMRPPGHTHALPMHIWPVAHAMPQVPQFDGSVAVFTHEPEQSEVPLGHSQSPATQL
jgi:hypothetical protein